MEGTNLSAEEQAQATAELANLSGTNDNSAATEDNTDTTDNFEEEAEAESDEGSEEESNVKESKTEKKIKKLLSKKNQAEKKVETLEDKVERLEKESNTNKFYADFPDAKEHGEKIDALLEEKPGFSREDAYFLLQGRGEIQTRTSTGKFIGRPASGLSTPKDPTKGTTSDMESFLKNAYDAGGLQL